MLPTLRVTRLAIVRGVSRRTPPTLKVRAWKNSWQVAGQRGLGPLRRQHLDVRGLIFLRKALRRMTTFLWRKILKAQTPRALPLRFEPCLRTLRLLGVMISGG